MYLSSFLGRIPFYYSGGSSFWQKIGMKTLTVSVHIKDGRFMRFRNGAEIRTNDLRCSMMP